MHRKRKSGPCTHRNYLLDCAEYDALLNHAGHRCQICGKSAAETGHGKLFIDHEPFVGQWAVRGILCNVCNAHSKLLDAAVWAAYLADPWYLRMGLDPRVLDEPPVGSCVVIYPRKIRWYRRTTEWHTDARQAPSPQSWESLNKRYGPFNIQIVRAAVE